VATSLDITNLTRRQTPGVPYAKLVSRILPGWDISLVFVGEQRARTLNHSLRGKGYTPNVLSYAAGSKHGEIIICLVVAEKQAPAYGLSYRPYIAFLFIHGMLHLKGLVHGATMERRERALLASVFPTTHFPTSNGSTHSNRN